MSRPVLLLLCLSFGALVANAQIEFHPGLEAGVPLTDTLASSSSSSTAGQDYSFSRFHSETKRLLIGPSFRLDLPKGLGLEFDALYQRVDFDSASLSTVPEISYVYQSFEAVHENRWQFPLLVQYSHVVRKTMPFVEVGPAISTIGNGKGSFSSTSTISSVTTSSNNVISGGRDTSAGIVAGAGVDLHVRHAHLRPELRYSHWFASSTSGAELSAVSSFQYFLLGNFSAGPFRMEQNEASFLLGLSF